MKEMSGKVIKDISNARRSMAALGLLFILPVLFVIGSASAYTKLSDEWAKKIRVACFKVDNPESKIKNVDKHCQCVARNHQYYLSLSEAKKIVKYYESFHKGSSNKGEYAMVDDMDETFHKDWYFNEQCFVNHRYQHPREVLFDARSLLKNKENKSTPAK